MGKVVLGLRVSLDGFVNDKDGSAGPLYPDGATMSNDPLLQEAIRDTGAVVMGRHSYDMAEGDYTGYEFQVPIFVVTHNPPEVVAKGENDNLSFTFVTEGVESAIHQASVAAGEKDVTIVGGPNLMMQALKAGIVDEVQIDIVPILLGQGLRLFDNLGSEPIKLEIIQVSDPQTYTHLRYRVVK